MYTKNFDTWNEKKKHIETTERHFYVKAREIWWCMLGVNVGREIDGKHDVFERPVLVLKVLSKDTFLILPLTTRGKDDRDHIRVMTRKMTSYVKLSQVRVVSNKRFSRKVDIVPSPEFQEIKRLLLAYIA